MRVAYDGGGTLHLAFYDSAEHDLKYASRSPDGAWTAPVVVDAADGNVGAELSLAIDRGGKPGVAYLDVNRHLLKYAHLSGGKWSISVIDRKNSYPRPSLTFDAANRAQVSYFHPAGDILKLGQFDHGWRTRTVAKVKSADHAASGVAINPLNGTLAIAFQASDGSVQYAAQLPDRRGRIGAPVSAKWRTVGVEALDQGSADPSLSFDSAGDPAVAYYDTAQGQLMLATGAGGVWQPQAIARDDGHVAAPSVLFNPSSGATGVLFTDAAGATMMASPFGGTFSATMVNSGPAALLYEPGNGTTVTVTTAAGGTTTFASSLPAATRFSAHPIHSFEVDLSWTDNSGGVDGYAIERAPDGAGFAQVATVAAGATSYADTSTSPMTHYTYRVRTLDAAGNLAYSNTDQATTPRGAPTGFFADPDFTGDPSSGIELVWDASPLPVASYQIQRSADGVIFTDLATVAADATRYVDRPVGEGARYTYRLVSLATDGPSDAAVVSSAQPVWLRAPTNLTAVEASPSQINLTWTNNSALATGYRVMVSTDGIGFFPLANAADISGQFSVTTDAQGNPIAAGHTYYFRVLATSADDASQYSDVASITVT